MTHLLQSAHDFSNSFAPLLWAAAWQSAVIGLLISVIVLSRKRWASSLRYWLLLIALVKFLIPPFLALPTGLLSHLPSTSSVTTSTLPDRIEAPVATNMPPAVRKVTQSPANFTPESAENSLTPSPNPQSFPSTTPTPIPATSTPWPWTTLAVAIYFLGLAAAAIQLLRQQRCLARIVRRSTACNETLSAEFASLSHQLRIGSFIRLRISTEIHTPMAFGLLRPTILLPNAEWKSLTPSDRKTILLHELAHLKRRDPWINALQLLVRLIWWCHPIAHLVNNILFKVREECCDDLLLQQQFATPVEYSETLLRSVSRTRRARIPLVLEIARHPLEPRLHRILDDNLPRLPHLTVPHIAVLTLFAILLLPGLQRMTATAQDPKTTSKPASSPVKLPNRTFTIKVVDKEKKPLPDARVFADHVYRPDALAEPKIEKTYYFTDAQGEATVKLSGLSVDLRIWVSKPAFVPLHVMWASAFQSDGNRIPDQYELTLNPGSKIGGMIVDKDGMPISKARVQVRLTDDGTGESSSNSNPSQLGTRPVFARDLATDYQFVETDEHGHWFTENAPPQDSIKDPKSSTDPIFGDFPAPTNAFSIYVTHPEYQNFDSLTQKGQVSQLAQEPLRALSSRIVLKRIPEGPPEFWDESEPPNRRFRKQYPEEESPMAEPLVKTHSVVEVHFMLATFSLNLQQILPEHWSIVSTSRNVFHLQGPHVDSLNQSARITLWFTGRSPDSSILANRDESLPEINTYGMTKIGDVLVHRNEAAIHLWSSFYNDVSWVLPGDHIAFLGIVDLDQKLDEEDSIRDLISKTGGRIDMHVGIDGKRENILGRVNPELKDRGITRHTSFVVVGEIPEIESAKDEQARERAVRHHAQLESGVNLAKANGVRVVTLANFIEFLRQQKAEGKSDPLPAYQDGNSIQVPTLKQ